MVKTKTTLNRILILLIFTISSSFLTKALDTSEKIFDPYVRTLFVRNVDNFYGLPVIRMGTNDMISIKFDIISEDAEYLRYKLIHCNSDWQPSRLLESEYIEGFNEGIIDDYAFSSNTFVHYVNYNIEIPNPGMQILASGNYLLQVYPESDPDEILLQARFSVSENTVSVLGKVTSRTDKGFNTSYQQMSLALGLDQNAVINPYQDLIIKITQNNRPETTQTITHPMRVEGKTVVYEHDPAMIFNASDEYRRFEIVRADYAGMHVDSVRFGGSNWHAWLAVDKPRNDRQYNYDSTQHGRFMIDEYNADDPDLGADYITVHFTLDSPYAAGAEVYVDGDFTNHRFDEKNRMTYDHNRGVYTLDMPLKQGSYNYQYVVMPNGTGKADPGIIEGDKYETNNEYSVQVYLRQPGFRGDRLVGSAQVYSGY